MSSNKNSEFYRKLIQSVKNQRNNNNKPEPKKVDIKKSNTDEDQLTKYVLNNGYSVFVLIKNVIIFQESNRRNSKSGYKDCSYQS